MVRFTANGLAAEAGEVSETGNGADAIVSAIPAESERLEEDGSLRYTLQTHDGKVCCQVHFPSEDLLDSFSGFILPGSTRSAYDNEAWILRLMEVIHLIIKRRKPILAICFGHQLLSKVLCGHVTKNCWPFQIGYKSFDVSPEGSTVLLDVFRASRTQLALHYSHQDVVTSVPPLPSLVVLGRSSTCPNDGMILGSPPTVLSVQGHPEFSTPAGIECLQEIAREKYKNGVIGREAYDSAIAQSSCSTDYLLIGKAMVRLFLQQRTETQAFDCIQ